MDSRLNSLSKLLGGPVLITGHTGFKGTWLTLLLEQLGVEVVGYSLAPEVDSIYSRIGLQGRMLEEFADNPFLPKFYEQPERYAFPLELSFLSERFSQLKKEWQPDLFQPKIISDYFIAKCNIFASNNLQEDEKKLFNKMYELVAQQMVH
jgi:hypothetical protein